MPETVEHRIIRSKSGSTIPLIQEISESMSREETPNLAPEQHYIPRPPRHFKCEPTTLPTFLTGLTAKVQSTRRQY